MGQVQFVNGSEAHFKKNTLYKRIEFDTFKRVVKYVPLFILPLKKKIYIYTSQDNLIAS